MKKNKKRWIALDADKLLFEVCEGKFTQNKMFAVEDGLEDATHKVSLKKYKERFKALVQDVENEISANMVGKVKGIKVFFSDPDGNFRDKIYSEYKANRDKGSRSKLFYRLRKWALKQYGYVKGTEADDVVAHYVREKNYIGASFDKDLLRGIAGDWFDTYHTRRFMIETSYSEAHRFNMIQNLTGDPTDNIKALPKKAGDPMIDGIPRTDGTRKPYKVTEKLAIELLDEFGWDWNGIVKAFESKGFSEKEALLTRRLTSMEQWSPKKGVKLWKPSKN